MIIIVIIPRPNSTVSLKINIKNKNIKIVERVKISKN